MIGQAPTLSVSEFVAVFNQSLEVAYPTIGVVGELANFRISRGRWVYFNLKDEGASVSFFGSVRALPGPLEEGLMLEVHGRPRLHPQYGFSVNVDSIQATGEGSIKKAQDLLKQKLLAEGLFAEERKRPLPLIPQRIGLITSGESAALADFRKIIDARWGRVTLELIDVQVQGAEAPAQIVEAIKTFNELANPPEILVVIRGGGSAEDLAAFSNEAVVRAVAASRLPTLVAIGHEVDISLAELAADRRASTPSNAAEMIVPDRVSEKRLLDSLDKYLRDVLEGKFTDQKRDLAESMRILTDMTDSIFQSAIEYKNSNKQLLKLLDPAVPLKRGYSLTRNEKNQVIRSVGQIKQGELIKTQLKDGNIKSRVEEAK